MIPATALGIAADGSSQISAMASALTRAAGRAIYFPKGVYAFDLSVNATLIPLAGTRLVGDGAETVFRFGGAVATRNVFDITNNGVSLENLSIEIDAATTMPGAVVQLFRLGGARDFRLKDVNIDGQIGSNHLVFVLSPIGTAGKDFTGITIDRGYYRNLTRFYLRVLSADQTATISSFKIRNARFEAFSRDIIALNSPYGETSDIFIEGASFASDAANAMLAIGSGKNVRVISCFFQGNAKEAIHIEESLVSAIIAGNNINLSRSDAIAIFITDNNLCIGQYVSPRNTAIMSNIIVGPGKGNLASRGILLVNDATGTKPADTVIINSNIVGGFGRAVSATDDAARLLLVNNILKENAVAAWSLQPITGSENNLFVANDSDVVVMGA